MCREISSLLNIGTQKDILYEQMGIFMTTLVTACR